MNEPGLSAIPPANGEPVGEKESTSLYVGLMCPSCFSKLTRRSMRRSFKDRFMSGLGRWPYRCQMCNMRFTGPKDPGRIEKVNARREVEAARKREEAELEHEAIGDDLERADLRRADDSGGQH